jgi:hypothetical protein
MAIEFLAWHLFFGLALPFAAFGFRGGGKVAVVRIGLVASGVLRLAGLLGPAVGDLIWRLPGVVGYGVVFPLVCLMIGMCSRSGGVVGSRSIRCCERASDRCFTPLSMSRTIT